MKHKTAELEGALLDAAVAKALPTAWDAEHGVATWEANQWFRPSSQWQYGGPIIERERIKLHPPETRRPGVNWEWQADCYGTIDSPGEYFQTEAGPTPLVAAMRAYVASKLGEEIELS